MSDLLIEVAENGFIVSEKAGQGVLGKIWAFESAENLGIFIEDWGNNKAEEQH